MRVTQLQAVWEKLGSEDPLWAVLSDPGRKDGRWDLAEFMATGQEHVGYLTALLDRHRISLGDRVLDFGCGVGRLTQALASQVPNVVGIDIASSMVDAARRINQYPDRVSYEHFDGRLLPFADDSFDGAVSLIVLQHVPPAVQVATMLELHRVVRPGGILLFQVPSSLRITEPLAPETCRAEITLLEGPATMRPLSRTTVRAALTNRGPGPWPADREIKLGNHWYHDGAMTVLDDGRAELPHTVRPGESIELDITVRAPAGRGNYELELDVVQEFVAWWSEHGSPTVRTDVTVAADAEPSRKTVHTKANAPSTGDVNETPLPVPGKTEGIEMHPVPVSLVRALFDHLGSELLAADDYAIAGPEWISHTYLIRAGRR